jgi:hypothetical protein
MKEVIAINCMFCAPECCQIRASECAFYFS